MQKQLIKTLPQILTYIIVLLSLFMIAKKYPITVTIQLLLASILIYLISAYMRHHHEKTLRFELIVEYILVAVLILIIIQTVFWF